MFQHLGEKGLPRISRRDLIKAGLAVAVVPWTRTLADPGKEGGSTIRLAVAFWHSDGGSDTEVIVERLKRIGVKGVVLVTGFDSWPDADVERVGATLKENGVFVAELALRGYQRLGDSDDRVRGEGIDAVKRCIRVAHLFRAHSLTLHWSGGTAREWWSEETWGRVVRATRDVAVEAERLDVNLGFHSLNVSPWDTPEQHRRLADEVGSPRVKVLLDPVNLSMTARTVYNTTDLLNRTFDLIGDLIIGVHAKDVALDPKHWVVKINEVAPGTGSLDYETLLRRMSQLDHDTVLTIEHLKTDVANVRAKNYIEGIAQSIGVKFG